MGLKPIAAGTPVQHEKVSFGDSSKILREGNLEMFLPLASKEDLLKESLSDIEASGEERKALADLFQSISTGAKFTHEILDEFNKVLKDSKNKKLKDLFTIIYTKRDNVKSQDKKKAENKILLDKGHQIYGLVHSGQKNPKENYKMEDLCQGTSEIVNSISSSKNLNLNFVNRGRLPTKLEPHYSAILINDPDVRVGLKNSLEMSTFLNVINTLEFSRAYPYFNAVFILPDKVNKNQEKPFKTASMNQFLFGGSITGKNASSVASSFESKVVKRLNRFENLEGGKLNTDTKEVTGVEANMSLFTSPQTMINANEMKGHFDSVKAIIGEDYGRGATPRDTMLPFMTLKEFTIDASPTRGLMSYKTGKLSVVLHDKNRMIDIAPLIKPDLFGAFGAEIVIEYGWSHPDVNTSESNNKIGEFINSSRCTEKYMIVNSSFTIDNNGMVNIDLAVAAKGPVMFKLIEVLKSPEYTKFSAASEKINTKIQGSLDTISNSLGRADDKISLISQRKIDEKTSVSFLDISDTADLLSGKKSLIPEDVLGQMKEFINRFDGLKSSKIILGNKNLSPSGPANLLLSNFGFKEFYNKTVTTETLVAVSELRNHVIELMDLYAKVIADQEVVHETKDLFIKSILGGTIKEDPFYNKNLAKDIKITNNKRQSPTEIPRYVSLGSIISSIIGNYFINGVNNSVDEIQLVFYTANENAGYMANRNVSSILIDTEKLKEVLTNISSKPNAIITIESLLGKIFSELVHQKDNVSYGLSSYYSQVKNIEKDEDLEEEEKKKKKESLSSKKEEALKKIYKGEEKDRFVVPQIHFVFDSLTSKSSQSSDATIARITIYDRHDTPFQSINSLIQKHTGLGRLLEFNNKISKIQREQSRSSKEDLTNETDAFKKKKNKLKKDMTSGDSPLLVQNNKELVLSPKTGLNDIKKFIRRYMPYTKIGTQNSGIINASMSTINEGKLLTTYLSRPDRNNELIETRVKTDLPLRVMPSQAQVELFGCPWVQFAQMIFLDFGTETTIDNQYNVTGISHQISPGKFTTSLKLSYGDFYGPVENAVNNITDLINNKLEEKLKKRKLEREKEIFDSSKFSFSQPSFAAGSVFSGDIDTVYLSLLSDPNKIKDALQQAGFEYDETSQENPPVKLTTKGPRAFKGQTFELFGFNYGSGTSKRLKSGQKEAILSLARLVLKYRIIWGDNKVVITDSFREPDAGGSINSQHKAGLAFDILTSTFYTKPTYVKFEEGKYIPDNQEGQLKLNSFYELAKGEGYNSFGIGNGVLHIDARKKGKGASWVYNYDRDSNGKKGKGHSSFIGNSKDPFNVDQWKPNGKSFIEVNRDSWIREIWAKYNKDMSSAGFKKEGAGYDYLPYEFKTRAGVEDIDKDFTLDQATSSSSESLFVSRVESIILQKENLRSSEFQKLFINNFKITFKNNIIDAINKTLEEGKTILTLSENEKKAQYKKVLEKNGLKNLENYVYKDISIFNDVKRSTYFELDKDSQKGTIDLNKVKLEEEKINNELAIKPFDNVPAKILKIKKDSKRIELKYTTIAGNSINEFTLPVKRSNNLFKELLLNKNQYPIIENNEIDLDINLKLEYTYLGYGEEQQKNPDVTIIGVPKFKSEFTYEVIDTLSFKIKYAIFPYIANDVNNPKTIALNTIIQEIKTPEIIEIDHEFFEYKFNNKKEEFEFTYKEGENKLLNISLVAANGKLSFIEFDYNKNSIRTKYKNIFDRSPDKISTFNHLVQDIIAEHYLKNIFKIDIV